MSTRAGRHTRSLTRLLVVGAVIASLDVGVVDRAGATTLPAGKANWVVAVAGLNTAAANNYRNWVRLGYYTFDATGKATTNYWTWAQRSEPIRINAVFADCTAPVPDCWVRTVGGFQNGPMGGFVGTYSYPSAGVLQVSWKTDENGVALANVLTERWDISTGTYASGAVARIVSPTFETGCNRCAPTVPAPGEFSSYSASFGVGWGSNYGFDSTSRASMTTLRTDPGYDDTAYRGRYIDAAGGGMLIQPAGFQSLAKGSQDPADSNYDKPWQVAAAGTSLGWVEKDTGCQTCTGSTNKSRVHYLAQLGGGRRNIYEYWCQCLAQGKACYLANSHPQPLLQIVDDNGVFRGWVGVEAFTHVNPSTLQPDQDWAAGYWALFDMTEFQLDVPAL